MAETIGVATSTRAAIGSTPMTILDAALQTTLGHVAEALADASDPWWIIASAAAALHGVRPITVRDVDVMISIADAERLRRRPDIVVPNKSGHPLFRSALFLIAPSSPLAIEYMAGFHIAHGDTWKPVVFRTRDSRSVGDHLVFVPSREELVALFRQMDRPKDLERARQLEALDCGGIASA